MSLVTPTLAEELASKLAALDLARQRVAQLAHEVHELEVKAIAASDGTGEAWETGMGMLVRAAGKRGRRAVNHHALSHEYEGLPPEVQRLIRKEEVAVVEIGRLSPGVAAEVRVQARAVDPREFWPTIADLTRLLKDPTPFIVDPDPPDRMLLKLPDGRVLGAQGEV